MDCRKIGEFIQSLRKEHKLTQQALAEKINVGDKAVSKWERGHGCPDVSVMPALARVFNISVETLLRGDLSIDESKGDTVKNANFYVCPQCGNFASSTTDMELLCCGKRLTSLQAGTPDNEHALQVQSVEGEYHIESAHPMVKEHYIGFVALVSPDAFLIKRLYPEWNLDIHLPQLPWATLYWYCGEHGLFSQKLRKS